VSIPRWRTTAVHVLWRAVGEQDGGRCRAGNTQGRGRPRCQDARHHARSRGGRGTTRAFPPWPWSTRPSLRCASRSETCRGVPSRRRRPPASIVRRHLRAFGCSTTARRCRTAGGLHTTGRVWRFRGRTRSKTGHGRCRVRSSTHRIPERCIRKGLSATCCSLSRHRTYGRSSAALLWSGARRSCGAS
jgi:hypothetical protein